MPDRASTSARSEDREAAPRTADLACICERPWPDHDVFACHGGIVCGGYVEHGCATPGCMEPAEGVHGAQCRGFLIACPNESSDALKVSRGALSKAWAAAESALPEGSDFTLSFVANGPDAGWYVVVLRPAMSIHDSFGPAETAPKALRGIAAVLEGRLQARSTEQGGAG